MHSNQSPPGACSLAQWCAGSQPPECLLYVCNGPFALHLMPRGQAGECHLPAGWQGLLGVHGGLRLCSGAAQVWPVPQAVLVKLQFFIDQAMPVPGHLSAGQPLGWLAAASQHPHGSLQGWYVMQALQGGADYQAFAQALRRWESYQLVRFLHEQSVLGTKVQALAARYGVSISHFRRLCHQALGTGGKTELRDWRAARALLAVADGPTSLTDVALEHGYASSSHFSRDIRQMLGVMPSSLVDITRLPSQ